MWTLWKSLCLKSAGQLRDQPRSSNQQQTGEQKVPELRWFGHCHHCHLNMVSPKSPKKHQTLESFGVLGVLQLWVVKPNWIFLLKMMGAPNLWPCIGVMALIRSRRHLKQWCHFPFKEWVPAKKTTEPTRGPNIPWFRALGASGAVSQLSQLKRASRVKQQLKKWMGTREICPVTQWRTVMGHTFK